MIYSDLLLSFYNSSGFKFINNKLGITFRNIFTFIQPVNPCYLCWYRNQIINLIIFFQIIISFAFSDFGNKNNFH